MLARTASMMTWKMGFPWGSTSHSKGRLLSNLWAASLFQGRQEPLATNGYRRPDTGLNDAFGALNRSNTSLQLVPAIQCGSSWSSKASLAIRALLHRALRFRGEDSTQWRARSRKQQLLLRITPLAMWILRHGRKDTRKRAVRRVYKMCSLPSPEISIYPRLLNTTTVSDLLQPTDRPLITSPHTT